MVEGLARVMESLPRNAMAELEVRDQARAVLRLVLDRPAVYGTVVVPNPATCPNCGTPAASTRSPYCGEHCREEAGFVRQVRNGLVEGWLLDEEKQVALGQVLWHVLGGGRPFRQSIIPPNSKKRALARTNGLCESCGAPAATFDHSGSGCNRDINLRVVCADCSETVPFGDPAHLGKPEVDHQIQGLADRIQAQTPLRCCDDAASWDWRDYVKRRQPAVPR